MYKWKERNKVKKERTRQWDDEISEIRRERKDALPPRIFRI